LTTLVPTTLEGPLAALREREILLLTDIAGTLAELGEPAAQDRQRLVDVAQDLRDMFFLVVIIGEFNAGKSTFINALLGDEVLQMGITPTTEAIHLVRYGEIANRKPNMRDENIYEWTHPNTGAVGVSLVDTPGTGSVFQKHEKTAKAFLHRSDLVIFVISAKRALAETERLYLELARDYGKKIILVVNQVDLLNPTERQEVRRFVEQQVEDLLNLKPLLFMVSAKEAVKAARDGASQTESGIEAVKAHLRGVFNETPPAQQKLLAQLDMAERVVKKYTDSVKARVDLVSADTVKVRDVQRELETQSTGLGGQLAAARAQIDSVFEGMRMRGLQFINENLSIRKIGRSVNREQLQQQFQDVVVGRALRDIDEATRNYINALVDNSRSYWRTIIERLNQLRDLLDQEVGGLDSNIYAEQREALQEAINIAESELKSYSSGKVIGDMQQLFQSNMNGFTMGALAALVGLIVALVATVGTPGPVIGVGAAALAAPALLIAAPITLVGGWAAMRYYRRVTDDTKREMNTRITEIEKTYHEALDNLTQKERNRLTQYGAQVLTPIFSRLEVLSARYQAQQDEMRAFHDQIAALRKDIEASRA
jgi:small GTP-binding protein